MADVTRLIDAAADGDAGAAAELLPLVYDELRRLAAGHLARERAGQTLQATALVHEAHLRLVGPDPGRPWNGRGHFFGAAAEAMRRILVSGKRGRPVCARSRLGQRRDGVFEDLRGDLHRTDLAILGA
ncbi:MAG TPA: ECF-type sigma factor, partial [Gemmataceae bacterium]|nr:ECF-type sigma factor [Gemmataceae bacterium]